MAKSKTVKPGNLSAEVQKMLADYGADVASNIREITVKIAKQGVKELRAASDSRYPGSDYAQGWTSADVSTRVTSGAVIYHGTAPGLPHLLEYGHALKRGGREIGSGWVQGRPHIEKVEKEIIKEFEEEVLTKL